MKNTSSQSAVTRKISQIALFIGLALALRSLSFMVYFLGAPGMRIGVAPIFSRMPALLFGPFYGGISAGIVDVLAYLIKPEGAYIPFLTMTAILDGIIAGFIWKLIKNADVSIIRRVLWIIFSLVGILGLFNLINTSFFPNSPVTQAIDALGKNKGFFVLGLVAVSAAGLILLTLDFIICKKYPNAPIHKYYLRVLPTFGAAGMTVTILNTFILRWFIPELGQIGFVIFFIPRVVKEAFLIVIISYIASFLLTIYDRFIKQK